MMFSTEIHAIFRKKEGGKARSQRLEGPSMKQYLKRKAPVFTGALF